MKKILLLIMVLFIVTGCSHSNNNRLSIVTTNYPSYDFIRAITKDVKDTNIELLIKPGAELHDYEPTPQDIIKIQKSDIFIYVGGDSDNWINEVLDSIDTSKTKVIKLMDLVANEYEGNALESNDDKEYDEHVWTSPYNAKIIIEKLSNELINIDSKNEELYKKNTEKYINEINNLIDEIKIIVSNGKRKELVFGDRFPLVYFTKAFGLDYYAAFPGCSHQTEASAKTIANLIKKVKEDKIPVILKLELSNNNIANVIASSTGVKVLEFHSMHNVTKDDFDIGVTYIDLMKRNINVLKDALM